jgi:hypothetical protein
MNNVIKAEILNALRDAGIEDSEANIQAIAAKMKADQCSAEDAIISILEAAETAQAQRVQYNGKTLEGYQRKMAQMSMQQLYELANTGLDVTAEQVSDVRAELLAMRVRQDDANGKTFQKAAKLLGAVDAQAEAFEAMMGAINVFKDDSVGELPSGDDFFTKSLQSSFKPLAMLGAGK